MIIIFSQSFEQTTLEVIDWIDYNNVPFKRVNGVDLYDKFSLKLTNEGLSVDLESIDWSEANVIWAWRWLGFDERHKNYIKQDPNALDPVNTQLNHFIKLELKTLTNFFFDYIPQEKLFPRIEIEELNKLSVLRKAQELGIEIPDTFITTKRKGFESIVENREVITKAISNAPMIGYENQNYTGYTSLVKELPDEVYESFSPSLFQHHIKKKYEIRSFLLEGKFYSMAIFSQSDSQTAVDFRVYNYVYPNRTVPFQLPNDLEEKLLKLTDYFKLKSASVDIIKTTDNKYIFLEINCSGQFGMVSKPCNYYLERKMANVLINYGSDRF